MAGGTVPRSFQSMLGRSPAVASTGLLPWAQRSGTGASEPVRVPVGWKVVYAGSNLSTLRPQAPVVYWVFDEGVDVGPIGEDIVYGQPGDLWFVPASTDE